jgi:hypothetical protein
MKTKHALVVLKYNTPLETRRRKATEATKRGIYRKRKNETKYTQVFDKYAMLNDEQVVRSYQTYSEQLFKNWYESCYIPTTQDGEEYTNKEKVDWLEETWADTLMRVASETVPNTFVEEGKKTKTIATQRS